MYARVILSVAAGVAILSGCSSAPAPVNDPTTAAQASSPSISATPTLSVERHFRTDLVNFDSFAYDSITVGGLNPAAKARVEAGINGIVDQIVEDAVKDDAQSECLESETRCGLLEISIKQASCVDYLCIRVDIASVPIEAATSDSAVLSFTIDTKTGEELKLEDVYGSGVDAQVKRAVMRWQQDKGYYPGDFEYSLSNITGWLPATDGLHVWFPKYSIGAGAEGPVEILVPSSSSTEMDDRRTVSHLDEAVTWMCEATSVASLPVLKLGVDDPYSVSALQELLIANGFQSKGLTSDGEFGPVTERNVKEFQSFVGLNPDGLVGPVTWENLMGACHWATDDSAALGNDAQETVPQDAGTLVPNVIGMRNKDAQRALSMGGLTIFSR